MPVQFYNLGFHLFHADASQQMQNILNQATRAGNEVAQFQVKDQGKAETTSSVQAPKETENREIQGEGRGAHSFQLKEEEEQKEEEKKPAPPPEDPTGKGRHLDLSI